MHEVTIIVFIPTLTSGGAEKQAVILANVLQKKYKTHLIVWNGAKIELKFKHYIDENKIQYDFLHGSTFVRFLKLVSLFRIHKASIIFNFLASNNFYGTLAGKIAFVPHIIGGIRNAEIPSFKLIIQKILHNHFLEYTVFNNFAGSKNLISKGFIQSKCIVIPNCFENKFETIIRSLNQPVVIVSLARFVPQKDYYTALKAIRLLIVLNNLDCSKIKYRIIGHGELENQINSWIDELDIRSYVEVFINPSNSLKLVEESDIFLLTSLFEGTSNSIMEAMSFSLPVVATDAGDNNLLITHNENGYIAPIGDYEKISSYLYELLIDHDKRISFGIRGSEKLIAEYSLDRFEQNYCNLITKLIDGSQNV